MQLIEHNGYPPIKTKPYQHQIDGWNKAKELDAYYFGWDMASGKSKATIDYINGVDAKRVLIICPKAVIDVWPEQFELHSYHTFKVLTPKKGTVKKRSERTQKELNIADIKQERVAVVLNYESAWRPGFGPIKKNGRVVDIGLLRSVEWDVIVYDEAHRCVEKSTLISTPLGDIPIEQLKINDIVYGYNENLNEIQETRITHIFQEQLSDNTYNFNGLTLTGNHPIKTQRGYIDTDKLKPTDSHYLFELRKGSERNTNKKEKQLLFNNMLQYCSNNKRQEPNVYAMQQAISTKANKHKGEILLRSMQRYFKESITSGFALCQLRYAFNTQAENSTFEKVQNIWQMLLLTKLQTFLGIKNKQRLTRKTLGQKRRTDRKKTSSNESNAPESRGNAQFEEISSFKQKSITKSKHSTRYPKEVNRNSKKTRLQTFNRRQRQRINSATRSLTKRIRKWLDSRIKSTPLCNRYCEPNIENSNRSGRTVTQIKEDTGTRHTQGKSTKKQRLERFTLQERRNIKRPERSGRVGVPVYNIETTTGNYFANNILVHNCSSAGSQISWFCKSLIPNSKRRIALSGTPGEPIKLYAQFRALDQSIFGTSLVMFRNRYCVMGGFEGRQIIGYQNMDEFNHKLSNYMHRVETRDVIDLPSDQHINRYFDLDPATLKIYKELENEFIAEIDDDVITVNNALVKILRLSQITGGFLKLDEKDHGEIIENNKVDMVKELLEDLPIDEPVVIFSLFTNEVQRCKEAAAKTGRSVGELSGRMNDLKLFQDGKIDTLCIQIRSGNAGISLIRARIAIYTSTGYSNQDVEQSYARLIRPGQKNNVVFYHILARDTIDIKIQRALSSKQKVVDFIMDNVKTRNQKAA
jgi:hypothetical protein